MTNELFDKLRSTNTVTTLISMLIIFGILAIVVLFTLVSGCVDTDSAKTAALDAISPVVVLKGSTQYEKMYPEKAANDTPIPTATVIVEESTVIPTAKPTVTVLPTRSVYNVNPYSGGERWEGQWYRWDWLNVSGLQDAKRGIVVYNHIYMDSFTYWDDAWGNYYKVYPQNGYRFLAVFVHEEDFSEDNSGWWGYTNSSFSLQYDYKLHKQYTGFNFVYRIKELEETYGDYYNKEWIHPFGLERVFGGLADAKTGGYHLEPKYSLWSGACNSWDGYLLYEIPKSATDSDIRIVGNFASKNVNWRFDADDHAKKYASVYSDVARADNKAPEPTQTLRTR